MILVSIHDVAPPNLPAVQSLWDRCLAAGVTPALLVVPDWHGNAPIEQDPAFLDWVRQAMAQGADKVAAETERAEGAGQALATILDAVETTVDQVSDVAATAEETAAQVETIGAQAQTLAATAHLLVESVAQFRIDAPPAQPDRAIPTLRRVA